MMRSLVLSIVFCCLASNVHSAAYRECKNFPIDNIENFVKVSRCKDTFCPLKKGTRTDIEIKFRTEKEVKEIFNKVSADVGVLNLPFLGVDGTSANKLVFEEDGTTPATFPLVPEKVYIYKNGIDVLKLFPNIKVDVRWALVGPDGSIFACFEVPARIIN